MLEENLKIAALTMRSNGSTYDEIGKNLGISLFSARSLCVYKKKTVCKKRGPKFKLTKHNKLNIKRTINRFSNMGENINSSKIIENIDMDVSTSTVQRYLTSQDMKYKKISSQIFLTKKHKSERIRIVHDWITNNHNWEITAFSDEKRFSLDGPDHWKSYVNVREKHVRNKRQCGGGGIMVWLMCLPNGLLCFRTITSHFKSCDYIDLLRKTAVPIMKLNICGKFYFQQDNAPIHTAINTKQFMKESHINVVEWPAKSPDLNIVEDIWKTISDNVYDGYQFKNRAELLEKIQHSINDLNRNGRDLIKNLYGDIRNRLCKVLIRKGSLINK